MYIDLTKGRIAGNLILFALPMIAGDLLQQLYNIADTLIVGRFIGSQALAAVGSAYSLMTFLTSIFLGMSMGAGVLFAMEKGRGDMAGLRAAIAHAFVLILLITVVLNALLFAFVDPILRFLEVPRDVYGDMRAYLMIIFVGMTAVFLYNFFACALQAAGNSLTPLIFLGCSAAINIGLDLWFIIGFGWGVRGAAAATVIAQLFSGAGILIYFLWKCRELVPRRKDFSYNGGILREILGLSLLTCAQQSCMNFGILLVQRLVNTFGAVTMAAFAVGVKIDAFAYLPVQDFGNAFSTFISQNCGAGETERQKKGVRQGTAISVAFSLAVSALVWIFAEPLMKIFVDGSETAVISCGVRYLHIEGAFYLGIGCLFLLYGLFRGMGKPGVSLVLTIISLGTRVALAYALAPVIGETGIWMSVPIGWALADAAGYLCFIRMGRGKKAGSAVVR